ncbi:Tn3 family transposase [Lichenicola cladoniae]|uniref:Tn3 family transposase n=1 Tax=Lichenicola cladoniae TaxID=1484109 RepID=A0A6M8HLM4_9PROT|nr:Tn3 family transposase [Lichenicola cladoniae]
MRYVHRSSASLLEAIGILREIWQTRRRGLPDTAPTGFIRRSWRSFVMPNGKIDRRPYELCVLSELGDRLRAGDIWVEGSQHDQSFDNALIPRPSFDLMKANGPLPIAVSSLWGTHLEDRQMLPHGKLVMVTALARIGQLPDARLDGGELKITPLKATTPPEAGVARNAAYDLLPRIRITDLLMEVDRWTDFSARFTHQRTGRAAEDRTALLATVLADGINLGLTRMAETCSGVTSRRLAWVHD